MSSIKQNEEVKGSAEALRQDKSSKLFKKQADLLPQESKVIGKLGIHYLCFTFGVYYVRYDGQ